MHNTIPMKLQQPLILEAHAKINLSLNVLYRRPDGYHQLDSVFQRLSLHDTLTLASAADGITLTSTNPELPLGPANLIYGAAALIQKEYGVDYGVSISLIKRIPVAAGLGGGSADAAAILRGLPGFWRLPALPADRIPALARALGADVLFCLFGVTARARGIGDLLEALPEFTGYDVLLIKPHARLSTASVYERLSVGDAPHPNVDRVIEAMRRKDLLTMGGVIGNTLEQAAFLMLPEIAEIKRLLQETGAPVVLMSGSGPTVFGLSGEPGWAAKTAPLMNRRGWWVITARTA